jgi:hypothetical protein
VQEIYHNHTILQFDTNENKYFMVLYYLIMSKENTILYSDIIEKKYKEQTRDLKKVLKSDTKYEMTIYASQNDENTMEFKSETNKVLLVYEILGVYDTATSIFSWSWKHELIDRKKSQMIKKIKDQKKRIKSDIINGTYSDSKYLEQIYYYVSNPIFLLNSSEIEGFTKICTVLTQSKGIIHQFDSGDNRRKIFYVICDIVGQ